MVNCLSRVEVRARLWGFRSDNGDVPGMRFASSGLRLLAAIFDVSKLDFPRCAADRTRRVIEQLLLLVIVTKES